MKGLLKILLFMGLVWAILAQVQTGNIYGKVVDPQGTPLPGVTVTLTSNITGTLTAVTSKEGNFRFMALPPGVYNLKFELAGFTTVERKNVKVVVGGNVKLLIEMKPAKLKEKVEVVAPVPVIDVRKTTTGANVTREELQSIPTARDPWVILELAPGILVDRENVGGSESGQQSNFVARGSGRAETSWNIDGVNITDQVSTGASPKYYDFDSFAEMQIQTAANDVTSLTGGVQINFVTKRGGNKFSGGGRLYYTHEKLQDENVPPELEAKGYTGNRIDYIADYGFNIGGPIVRDKLWFWTSYGVQDINQYNIIGLTDKTLLKGFIFKLNAQLGKHRAEFYFNWDTKEKEGRSRSGGELDAWESKWHQTSDHPLYKIQDEFEVGNLFVSFKASYFAGGFTLDPYGGRNNIAYYDGALKRYWGTYYYYDTKRPQYFAQLLGNYFLENFLGGNHEIKIGVEYKFADHERVRDYYSQRLYFYNGVSKYAYIYRDSIVKYYYKRFSAFIQDIFDYGNFTFLLGLRYDRQWGGTGASHADGTTVSWAGQYNLPPVDTEARELNFKWNTFSPRLGVIYDLSHGEGKTVVKANFSIYGSQLSSDFAASLASTYGWAKFRWKDLNGDQAVQPNEVTYMYTRDYYKDLDPAELFDSDLASPKTLELLLGFEKELLSDFAMGVNLIYRRFYDDYWDVWFVETATGEERMVQPDDWQIGGYIPDEYGGYAWWELKPGLEMTTRTWTTQRPDFYTDYKALEILFNKRLSNRWMLRGSITLEDWRAHYPTRASYIDPTNHEPVDLLDNAPAYYVSGSSGGVRAGMNSRWAVKLTGLYQLPYGFNLSASVIAREGFIIRAYYMDPSVERQGIGDNPVVLIAKPGTYRLPTYWVVNLRLEKAIRLKRFGILYLDADVFNVTNNNMDLDRISDAGSPEYNQPTKILNPRIVRFGMRLEF